MTYRSDLPFYQRFCANLFPLSVHIRERLEAFQNLGPSQIAQGQLQSGRKKYDLVPILFGFSVETAAPELPVRNQHFSEIGLWEDEIMCSGPNHIFFARFPSILHRFLVADRAYLPPVFL